MKMRRTIFLWMLAMLAFHAVGQRALTLEECRQLAIQNNKELRISAEKIRMADNEKKAALGADKDVTQFEVLFNQGQELANKMRGLLLKARGREDSSTAQGMEKAMKALADAIGRCAG